MTHPTNRPNTTIVLLASVLGAGAGLSGCTSADNDRFRFGGDDMLPAYRTLSETTPDPTPSVTGLDRSHWEPVTLTAPVHGTAHRPTYAPSAFDLDSMPRQRGEYPTVESALDLGERDHGADAWLAARTHGLALVDTVMLVPRMVIRPPTATDWSPARSYSRIPGQDPAPAESPATPDSEAQAYDPTEGFFDEADS